MPNEQRETVTARTYPLGGWLLLAALAAVYYLLGGMWLLTHPFALTLGALIAVGLTVHTAVVWKYNQQ